MTNHTYFNLNGHSSGTVDGHTLWMASSFYTPNNDECIPTGKGAFKNVYSVLEKEIGTNYVQTSG